MRLAIAQINATVGAVRANADKIINYILKAQDGRADIVIFPELALCGYPPEDLLFKESFLSDNRTHLRRVIDASRNIFTVVGFPEYKGGARYNAAALIYNKNLIGIYRKITLPNYGVFDEKRYFKSGNEVPVIPFTEGARLSVNICEDIWHPQGPQKIAASLGKAKIIINISASPFHAGKMLQREKMLKERAVRNSVFVCYCNLVGGQDELIFDGGSLMVGPNGDVIARAKQFEEDLLIADLDTKSSKKSIGRKERPLVLHEEVYSALGLGLRDYVVKNNFKKVVLGLSGGIDSALAAAISCDSLGRENVIGLSMPSKFTSKGTKRVTRKLAENLGIRLITLPIGRVYKTYMAVFKQMFEGRKRDITEENLQARIRGNILMAFSNKFGWLVVTTGNKSEISVGYCTIYGDMAGGFAVIKDIPKTMVYKLARLVNRKAGFDLIPNFIIDRAPTAELKYGQKDRDVLPPYSMLDGILDAYVEKDKSKEDIVRLGFNKKIVDKVISMVDKNEYKRRQSPPGVKIRPKAFGRDRRMPIVNKFSNG